MVCDSKGAAKFTGTTWSIYTSENSTLPSDIVSDIGVDSSNNVWFTTTGGIAKLNSDGIWVKIQDTGLPQIKSRDLEISENNNIYFATLDNGLVRYDGEKWISYNTDNSPLNVNMVVQIAFDNNNNLWVITNDYDINIFDGDTWYNFYETYSDVPNMDPINVHHDYNDNIWFGTLNHGLIKYDGNDFTEYNQPDLPIYNSIVDEVFTDYKGSVWVAASSLLRLYKDEWLVIEPDSVGLPTSYINDIYVDSYNNVWFATPEGAAVLYYYNQVLSVDNNNNQTKINILPNPANDYIEISWDNFQVNNSELEYDDIEIFNELGIKVMSLEVKYPMPYQRFDISLLPKGIYFLKIGAKSEKFIKY